MGNNCQTGCFEFDPSISSTIHATDYSKCSQTPPIMTINFSPDQNGTSLIVTATSAVSSNSAIVATIGFSYTEVSYINPEPGVQFTYDGYGNMDLAFMGNVSGLVANKDYILGDNYKIRSPGSTECSWNSSGFQDTYITFRRANSLKSILTTETNKGYEINNNVILIVGIILLTVILFLYYRKK